MKVDLLIAAVLLWVAVLAISIIGLPHAPVLAVAYLAVLGAVALAAGIHLAPVLLLVACAIPAQPAESTPMLDIVVDAAYGQADAPTPPPTEGVVLTIGSAIEEVREPALSPFDQYLAAITRISPYDRKRDWKWIDADKDCKSTRTEVLEEESQGRIQLPDGTLGPPAVEYDATGCRVVRGTWIEPFTATTTNTANDLDIDHVVPAHHAWEMGGWAWTQEQRLAYANDLENANHLMAMPKSLNRQKGDNGPDRWKPPRREIWCWYARVWLDVKMRYELLMTAKEAVAVMEMLGTCGG